MRTGLKYTCVCYILKMPLLHSTSFEQSILSVSKILYNFVQQFGLLSVWICKNESICSEQVTQRQLNASVLYGRTGLPNAVCYLATPQHDPSNSLQCGMCQVQLPSVRHRVPETSYKNLHRLRLTDEQRVYGRLKSDCAPVVQNQMLTQKEFRIFIHTCSLWLRPN
jgi:hypothetical protein